LAQLCAAGGRWALRSAALQRCLQAEPGSARVWIELAFGHMVQGRPEDAMASLRQAVACGGEGARTLLRRDGRFAALGGRADFRRLVEDEPRTGRVLQALGLLR
jgi:hypothetical protein